MPAKRYTRKDFEVILKDDNLYYSEDGGETRYECYRRTAFSNAVDVPQLGIDDMTIEFGGTRRLRSLDDDEMTETIFVDRAGHLKLAPFSDEAGAIACVPLPNNRKKTMTVRLPDDRILLVDGPRYHNNRFDRRAFIHDGETFVQRAMTPMMIARDGGSIRFTVGTNKFFKPSPFAGPDVPCTWDDVSCGRPVYNRVAWGPGPDHHPTLRSA